MKIAHVVLSGVSVAVSIALLAVSIIQLLRCDW